MVHAARHHFPAEKQPRDLVGIGDDGHSWPL